MTEEEVKAEITRLEGEARQLVANANFINGALAAFNKMLNKLDAPKAEPEPEQK